MKKIFRNLLSLLNACFSYHWMALLVLTLCVIQEISGHLSVPIIVVLFCGVAFIYTYLNLYILIDRFKQNKRTKINKTEDEIAFIRSKSNIIRIHYSNEQTTVYLENGEELVLSDPTKYIFNETTRSLILSEKINTDDE
ncbi:MAG: hypothetical protein ACRCZB_05550 [Bacteroidales bacterium]